MIETGLEAIELRAWDLIEPTQPLNWPGSHTTDDDSPIAYGGDAASSARVIQGRDIPEFNHIPYTRDGGVNARAWMGVDWGADSLLLIQGVIVVVDVVSAETHTRSPL